MPRAVIVKDAAALAADDAAQVAAATPAKPVLTKLAAHIAHAYQAAENHRSTSGVTHRILEASRKRVGEYDPETKAKINRLKGSTLYFNLTQTKIESFIAWMQDMVTPTDDRPWDATPTPISTLEQDEEDDILDAAEQQFADLEPGEINPDEVVDFTMDLYDQMLDELREEANERCRRMVRFMSDQTVEGGFEEAMGDVIDDMSTYPTAILKGPVVERRGRLEMGEDGTPREVFANVPTWRAVPPDRFYPGPHARTVQDSYLCEVIDYDPRDLAAMRGVPGWDSDAIERILSTQKETGLATPSMEGEEQEALLKDRAMPNETAMPDATLRSLEFWGSVSGALLLEWGMKGVTDPHAYYQICAVMVGDEVVKASLNPHALAMRPYFACSFSRNRGTVWGTDSIPGKMDDCQRGANGTMRNLMNNLALGAGPMVAIDIHALTPAQVDTAHEMYPQRVYLYDGSQLPAGRKPVDFFQPDTNAHELMQVVEFFNKTADDRTMVPRYVVGDQPGGGAAQTATGLGMLMGAANRGIKRAVRELDSKVVRPAIEMLHRWNLTSNFDALPDANVGDMQIVARGAMATISREQTQARQNEFMAMTNNPTDLAIIGIPGRAMLLRKLAGNLDLDNSDALVPSEEDLARRMNATAQNQAAGGPAEQDPNATTEEPAV